jgi:UDP-N-acetylmuramoyl-tripeptide--D-alanyl-D-alanine ligase
MLRQVLSSCGKVHYSPASFNNHWGVPLTLARLPREADFGVFEIGMNHPDEIRPLVKMVRPHVAIITTIAAAHLGNFSGLEEIARAKAEIFEGIVPDGHAIINRDNGQYELLRQIAAQVGVAHIESFGTHPEADFRLLDYTQDGDSAIFSAAIGDREVDVAINAPGRHIAENAVAVLAAAYLTGADMFRVIAAFAGVSAAKGRGQRVYLSLPGGKFTLIDESYNANPASMRAAIDLLAASDTEMAGRRIAVLGDMLEMGEFSADVHRELAEPLQKSGINDIWLAGPDMAYLRDALGDDKDVVYRSDADELGIYVIDNIRPGDVLMIKSSKGTGFGRIVEALTARFAPVASPE